jgi:carbon monoxide dehydrogenase subunit G
MTTVERTGLIGAPIDAVWDVLSDFAAISAWAPNVDHSCLMTEQTDGIGTVRRIQTNRTTIVETTESWEPGVGMSYRITGLPPVIKSATNTWRLGASGDSTMVLLTTDIDTGPKPPQQVIAKAVGRRLAAASEQMIAGLTAFVETNARGVTT